MVMRFGMSEKLGPRVFGHDHGQPFLGRHIQRRTDYSSDVAKQIDDEVRLVIATAYDTARRVLEDHRGELEYAAEILLRRETIEREQFIQLLDGKTEEEVFGGAAPSVHPTQHTRRHRRRAAPGARPQAKREPAPARTPA
jgi:cell division protease FtsH